MITVLGRVQTKRDTSANWAYVNPVLLAGEIGIDITVLNFKVGDGATEWSSLPFYIENNNAPSPHTITAGVTPMPTTIAFISATYPPWNAVKTATGEYDNTYPVSYDMGAQQFVINAMDDGAGKALESYILTINP